MGNVKKEESSRLADWLEIIDLGKQINFFSHEYSNDNPEVESKLSKYRANHGIFSLGDYISIKGGWMATT